MVIGGAGSGKSSCIAIPTLRAWNSRVFAIDIKGELYANTSSQRNVKALSPTSAQSLGYEPFFMLNNTLNKAQEARAIAQALIPVSHDIKDPFWIESAQNFFTALTALYRLGKYLS